MVVYTVVKVPGAWVRRIGLALDGEVEAVGLVFDGLEGAQGEGAGVSLDLPVGRALCGLLDREQGFAGEVGRELAEREEGERAVDVRPAMWPIPVSIGASVHKLGDSLKEWISQADEALYRAQQEGETA
jgi:hypothetical protein